MLGDGQVVVVVLRMGQPTGEIARRVVEDIAQRGDARGRGISGALAIEPVANDVAVRSGAAGVTALRHQRVDPGQQIVIDGDKIRCMVLSGGVRECDVRAARQACHQIYMRIARNSMIGCACLVLPARARRLRTRPFDLVKEPLSRERSAAAWFFETVLQRRGVGRRRLRCRRQHDQGWTPTGSAVCRATSGAPEAANHAVREYLAVLDDAAFGVATPIVPKFISHADPTSRRAGANGRLAFVAYCIRYPDRTAPATSSTSPPPPKTSASWPS